MRLQAFLARAGAAPSRRKAEAVILSGRVSVNGRTAGLGSSVEPSDAVALDGRPVALPDAHAYFALNKPAGFLTTMQDDFGRPTVADLMPEGVPGLVPVGRLDADTTGLILLTNDGGFANRVSHPASRIEKEYELLLARPVPEGALEALARGPELEDGPMLPPRLQMPPEKKGKNLKLGLTIHEGRNRIIRRACSAVGLTLLSLSRTRVGPVRLDDLRAGEIRRLTEDELRAVGATKR